VSVPQFVGAGSLVTQPTAVTVSWPPQHLLDDIGVLLVETANQAVTTPAGWTLIGNIGTGTSGVAAASTAIFGFWKRAASGAEADVTVADSGARQTACILAFRGCVTTGSPIDASATSVQATASTGASAPGLTTTADEALVVNVFSNALTLNANTIQPGSLSNGSLTNIVERLNTQADGVLGTTTSTALPVGMMAFGSGGSFGDVGENLDLVSGTPRVQCCMFVPNINNIGAQIDVADQFGIQLVLNVAGTKPLYCDTVAGVLTLNMGTYESNVRRFAPDNTAFADRLKFADAVRRKRIVFYVVDEPNRTNAQDKNVPDITPTQVNQMALIHKAVWQGYDPICIVRATATTLWGGWSGLSRPSGGYTGVDYCWLQYTNTHAKGGGSVTGPWQTPIEPDAALQTQRDYITANNVNMGMVMSLNLWSGGPGVNSTSGVAAAWDTDGPGGSSALGYVVGISDTNEATVLTSPPPNSTRSLVANPDWIKKVADLATADSDLPFLLFWQHATSTNPASDFLAIYQRQDYQDALEYAINKGLTRSSFNGWRTPK